jgi:hypothetical protein
MSFSTTSNLNKSKLNSNKTISEKLNLTSGNSNLNGTSAVNNSVNILRYQSSNTLQNSINAWTIGKEERFNNLYKKSITEGYYNPEFSKSTKACNFGIGQRGQMVMKGIDALPSPFSYIVPAFVDVNLNKKKGCTMSSRTNYKVHKIIILIGRREWKFSGTC